jgi:hypothetical protein
MSTDYTCAMDTLLRCRERFVTHSQLSAPDLGRPVINEDLFWGTARRWLEYGLSKNLIAEKLLASDRVVTWPDTLLPLLDEASNLLRNSGNDGSSILAAIRTDVDAFKTAVATIRSRTGRLGSTEDVTMAAAVRDALTSIESVQRRVTAFVILLDDRIHLLRER